MCFLVCCTHPHNYIHTHEQTHEKCTHEIFLSTLEIFAGLRRSVLPRMLHSHTLLHTYTPDLCCAATQRAPSYTAHTHSLTYIHMTCLLRCDAVCFLVCGTQHFQLHAYTRHVCCAAMQCAFSHTAHTHSIAYIHTTCLLRCNAVCLLVVCRKHTLSYMHTH